MNSVETKDISVIFILEVLGRPKEHLTEALEKIIKELGDEKRVNVKSKKINEPVLMKDQKDFYTSFAEIEIEIEKILDLAILMFKYMPAHVEIIHPEIIALQNNDWNDILNELTRRLHGYDEVARIIQTEKVILEKKLRDVLEGQNVNINMGPKKETKQKKKSSPLSALELGIDFEVYGELARSIRIMRSLSPEERQRIREKADEELSGDTIFRANKLAYELAIDKDVYEIAGIPYHKGPPEGNLFITAIISYLLGEYPFKPKVTQLFPTQNLD